MCWMTVRSGHDALAESIRAVRRHERANGHSWGMAWVDDDGLHIERGLGTMPDDVDVPVAGAALAHTRAATVGQVSVDNAHPFPIERGGETVAALAHNGTWHDAPDVPGWSDTRVMAYLLSETLDDMPGTSFGDALRSIGEVTGETLAALHRDGSCYVYSGRYGITRRGSAAASSGLDEELGDGLHVVSPGMVRA